MEGHNPQQPTPPKSPVEKYFSSNRKGHRPAPLKLGVEKEADEEPCAGSPQGVDLPDTTKFFLPPSPKSKDGDEIDEPFEALEDLLTYEQQERVQRWVDEQPSCYAMPTILTPRSPRPPPLGTQFFGLSRRSILSRSTSSCSRSELDLESGSGDGPLGVVEAYRDDPSERVLAGCNAALCHRCGTHLAAAAGSAGREWSAGKVVIYAAGTLVMYAAGAVGVLFWAVAVWDYLTEYHS